MGGEVAIQALLMVDAPSLFVRGAVAASLGVLGDPRGVPRLLEWLDDDAARSEAAEALGRIGEPAAIPALAALLESKHWWVRTSARDALIEIGHPDAVEALRADRWLLRRARVRRAQRSVAFRRAREAGQIPTYVHPWPRRLIASAGRNLCLAGLVAWLPVVALGADPRPGLALLMGGMFLGVFLVADRRERQRSLDLARRRAAQEPLAEVTAPVARTVLGVLAARPLWSLGHLAVAIGLEAATGGAGIAAALLAGLVAATALERLEQARLVRRWQREAGERLLAGDGRMFLARRRM